MEIKQLHANAGNYGPARNARAIKYIVIHYTGNDGDTAENNARYYASTVVKSSAHYFVDANSIYQSVPDLHTAWAVGGRKYPSCPQTGGGTLYNICRNTNSISIELCDAKRDGTYAPAPETVTAALKLTRSLMAKYNVPQKNVIRHFDVTGKLCPAYWAGRENEAKWKAEFWNRLNEPSEETEEEEMRYNTMQEIREKAPWAADTVLKLIAKGAIRGGGAKDANGFPADMDLSADMLRMMVSALSRGTRRTSSRRLRAGSWRRR